MNQYEEKQHVSYSQYENENQNQYMQKPYYEPQIASQMVQQGLPHPVLESFDPVAQSQMQQQPIDWGNVFKYALIVILVIAFVVLLSRLLSGTGTYTVAPYGLMEVSRGFDGGFNLNTPSPFEMTALSFEI